MSTLASGILWSHGKEKGRGKELADDIDYRRFLYAQSKNLCDTKLNDIIALSQGDYTGEFEQQMQQERQYYDDLINSGKYKDAYDQLTRMEEMYRANQS